MQMTFNEADLARILGDHLRQQGFNMKHKTVTAHCKGSRRGKVRQSEGHVMLTIETVADAPQEPLKAVKVPSPQEDTLEVSETLSELPTPKHNLFGDED